MATQSLSNAHMYDFDDSGNVRMNNFDIGPDGKIQCVLPGAERVDSSVIAQRRADAPLKPKKAQRACDAGLFSDDASQLKLV